MKYEYLGTPDNLTEMVIIENPKGDIRFVNEAFCKCHGVSKEAVIGKSIFDFIIPEDRLACTAHRWVTPKDSEYKIQGRSKDGSGKIIWIQYIGKAFFSDEGELMEFQELAVDITAWKEKIDQQTKELMKLNQSLKDRRSLATGKKITGNSDGHMGNTASITFNDIITSDARMISLKAYAQSVAKSDVSVLIEGESGTGKEMFAQAIHNSSLRKNGPFVAINCGAITPELISSELFGYEGGSFTGASKEGKRGKFEMASGGTLFLDEIGEMPLSQQVALLRVLETKTIIPVGSNKQIPVDVRIICATNKNLNQMSVMGTFRQDLYYRIGVIKILIPPLRDRRGDILLLMGLFVKNIGSGEFSKDTSFTDEQILQLYNYDWPGNVRELKNVIERIRFSFDQSIEDLIGVPADSQKYTEEKNETVKVKDRGKDPEEPEEGNRIASVLRDCENNISMAARKLGISRNTLYKKIKKYHL